MRWELLVWTLVTQLGVDAAGSCVKDSCYNAIAIQQRGSPNQKSREADCRSILKTVVEDGTRTVTRLSISAQTSTVTTESMGSPNVLARDNYYAQPQVTDAPGSKFFPRDQIIVNGKRPTYASACKNVQSYGLACLCYGVRAATYYAEKTTIITRPVLTTTTVTVGFDYISYLRATGGAFCTNFNGYYPPLKTTTSTIKAQDTLTIQTTTTTSETVTTTEVTTSTTTAPVPLWRRGLRRFGSHEQAVEKRGSIVMEPTPDRIRDWPSSRISSACSLVATGVVLRERSTTITSTVSTTTSISTEKSVISQTLARTTSVTSLPSPGPIVQVAGSPSGSSEDVAGARDIDLPFAIGVCGNLGTQACMDTNGFVLFAGTCANADDFLQAFAGRASDGPTKVYKDTKTGMDYRVDGSEPSRSIVFRWYVSLSADLGKFYNFTATVYESDPGAIRLDYLSMYEDGLDGEVFAQCNKAATKEYRYDVIGGDLVPGTVVTFDTSP